MLIVDAHLHLWDPSRLDYPWLSGALGRRFAAEEKKGARVSAEESSVFVQADCVPEQALDEVRWVGEIAEDAGVRGIVAAARLDEPVVPQLDALAEHPLVVGVRHILQDRDGLAGAAAFRAGARELAARGWTFDACVRAPQLPEVTALADAVPDLVIVLDHLGKPAVGTLRNPRTPDEDWQRELGALAAYPRAFCKLSGLPAEAGGGWDAAQMVPFLDAAAEAFGPDRLLWGSDWPVSSVSGGYRAAERARWAQTVFSWAQSRALDPVPIMSGTAVRVYSLPLYSLPL